MGPTGINEDLYINIYMLICNEFVQQNENNVYEY